MAFNVDFYAFSKKENSTKQPSGISTLTKSCVLKDTTSIINPTLIIYDTSAFNPYTLNYCYISTFGRYYFVNDWAYIVGQWECSCEVDVLATYKTTISACEKYVLRSAKKRDRDIVDELYPSQASQPNYFTDSASFNFVRNVPDGSFIVGIANMDSSNFSAVSYYKFSNQSLRSLITYMLQPAAELWENLHGFTDTVIRAVYSPFDYIKSCKWFAAPITITDHSVQISFGNYNSQIYAPRVPDDVTTWYSDTKTLYLPTGWLSLEAKYRVNPYAHIYIVCNPWGVIELNPLDFTDSRTIKVRLQVDLISGEGVLKIYKQVQSTDYFITQKSAQISIDIPLSNSNININGMVNGTLGGAAGIALAATSGGKAATIISGSVAALSGAANTAVSSVPSLSGSSGQSFNNIVSMDGEVTLIYQNTYFVDDCPNEKGHPLCSVETLSNLAIDTDNNTSGYILCLDGDIEINGAMRQEILEVSKYLTEGFYLE